MQETAQMIFMAIISVIIPSMLIYGVTVIAENMTAKTDSERKKFYINEISKAIIDAVSATNQTYVDSLKNTGAFTKEAQAEAIKKALEACIASISPAAQRFMEEAYGDITKYLTTKIEAEVRNQKLSPGTPLTSVLESTTDSTTVAATTAAATAAAITQAAIQQTGAEIAQAE